MESPILDFKSPLRNGGRPLKLTPSQLVDKFAEYVEWCKQHPLTLTESEDGYTGDSNFAKTKETTKERLISIGQFLVFIGETPSWWAMLDTGKQGKTFLKVKEAIKNYCEEYQKEMASNGMFNANIISRLLGLADKRINEGDSQNLTIVVKNAEEKEKVESLGELGV